MAYTGGVPKLWSQTIESHRREVGEAILDATRRLVERHGPLGVTMSRIAEETGIGRATLYKYFPDVEAILLAWHERHISRHLEQLAALCDGADPPVEKLRAVFEAYALSRHEHHDPNLAMLHLRRGERVANAHRELHELVRGLMAEGAAAGDVRSDVPPDELATYCIHALAAAVSLPSEVAVCRLVTLALAGLRPG